ncbi:GNAT family N-acetyltransferase [Pseudomonadales bacterium]|nr:GNAT family N-acetyltransferase [Pseudomonadales bacterium]
MSSVILSYKGISCVPVSYSHIESGWLDWMNNPAITQNLSAEGSYTKERLCDYLNETTSILFLACYSDAGVYFGNLRLYKIADEAASFGRLIGDEKYKGSGYGKLMSELATSLLFDFFRYDTIIVGNNRSNLASAASKLKTGFRKLSESELPLLLQGWAEDADYYIKSRAN